MSMSFIIVISGAKSHEVPKLSAESNGTENLRSGVQRRILAYIIIIIRYSSNSRISLLQTKNGARRCSCSSAFSFTEKCCYCSSSPCDKSSHLSYQTSFNTAEAVPCQSKNISTQQPIWWTKCYALLFCSTANTFSSIIC